MAVRSRADLLATASDLERGVARFAAWRAGRRRGERIPSELWALALGLARRLGASRTALALGVGYYSLQERLSARPAQPAVGDQPNRAAKQAVTLVELPTAPRVGGGTTCVIEVERADGAKLRIQSSGGTAFDLATVVRAFGERT